MKEALLPVRTSFYPAESLASLQERLQLANLYEPSEWAWICRTHSGENDAWWQPYKTSSWHTLAALTGIAAKRLYLATCHPYAPALQLPWQDVETTYVARRTRPALNKRIRRRYQRNTKIARYCPRCLETAHYERLHWQMTFVLACSKHRCLLQTACWHCRKGLRVRQLVTGSCAHCRADLTAVEPPHVTQAQLQLQRRLTDWLRKPSLPPPSSWPQQPTPILFELLRGFINALPPRSRLPTSQQLLEKRSRAADLLSQWPHNFYDYLDALAPKKSGRVTSDFGILYIKWLEGHWRHPELEFLQIDFDDYLVATYPPSFEMAQLARYKRRSTLHERLPYVSYDTASTTLGISRALLWFAMRSQLLSRYKGKPVIGRTELQRIGSRWQHGIPIPDLIQLFQLDARLLTTLCLIFSLSLANTTVPLNVVDAFALALEPMPYVSQNPSQLSSLHHCVNVLAFPLDPLLRAVLQGKIAAEWVGNDLWSTSLRTDDVLQLFESS